MPSLSRKSNNFARECKVSLENNTFVR